MINKNQVYAFYSMGQISPSLVDWLMLKIHVLLWEITLYPRQVSKTYTYIGTHVPGGDKAFRTYAP